MANSWTCREASYREGMRGLGKKVAPSGKGKAFIMTARVKEIEALLDACEQQELLAAERAVMERLWQHKCTNKLSEDEERKLRRDPRFETNLLGTLTRVTDVRSGERKEFVATITDLSRGGMQLRVDREFTPSRLVELTFAGPGGKIKRTFMEVVSIRKRTNDEGQWVELGCRRVEIELVQQMKLQEELIRKARKQLHNRQKIRILVVGPEGPETAELIARLRALGHVVEHVKLERQSVVNALKGPAHLVLFCRGARLRDDPGLLSEIRQTKGLATLVFLENEDDRLFLLQAGVDECVTGREQVSDQLLFSAIDRALTVKMIRRHTRHVPTAQALLVCADQSARSMVKYHLEECGYGCQMADGAESAMAVDSEQVDVVLAAFEEIDSEPFKLLAGHFREVPLVAVCQDLTKGHEAMVQGATMFFRLPPGKDDMRTLLESLELNLYLANEGAEFKPGEPKTDDSKPDEAKADQSQTQASPPDETKADQSQTQAPQPDQAKPDESQSPEPVAAQSAAEH